MLHEVANALVVSRCRFLLLFFAHFRSPPQPPLSQADEDEITWGSDELPIESISQERVNKGKSFSKRLIEN